MIEAIAGWTAAALTLLTFGCRNPLSLRVAALGANAAFLLYGTLADQAPIVALHATLVPINLIRAWPLARAAWMRRRSLRVDRPPDIDAP